MNRLGLIGLGDIAKKYQVGLAENSRFQLVSVCDLADKPDMRKLYPDATFYHDYHQMMDLEQLDYVLIATPPKTHYQLAKDGLNHSVNVLVEKPGTLSYEEIDELTALAKSKQLVYDVLFHWLYGNEVQYVQSHLHEFGQIQKVEMHINDPYMESSTLIKKDKIDMEGCWVDSGINILCLLSVFLHVNEIEWVKGTKRYDSLSKQPYQASLVFRTSATLIYANIRWTKVKNYKQTRITTSKGILDINHSLQAVFFNHKLIYDGSGRDRLSTHYLNYFINFNPSVVDTPRILDIHKKFLEFNQLKEAK